VPRLAAFALITGLALAGCATQPPPPSAAMVAATPDAALERARAFLAGRGFAVESAGPGVLIARGGAGAVAPDWASCGWADIRDRASDFNQTRRVAVSLADASVQVRATAAEGGSRIEVQPSYGGSLTDPFLGTPLRARCASTGGLEAALLGAVQA
jgi:hypothetical protein